MAAPSVTEHFLSAFERTAPSLPGADTPAVVDARRVALARFARLGLPTPKSEAWRYTSLTNWTRQNFDPTPVAGELPQGAASFAQAATDAQVVLLFVDGRLVQEHGSVPEGARVVPLGRFLGDADGTAHGWLQSGVELANDGPAALNLAFASDGVFVEVARAASPLSIEMVFLSTPAGAGHAVNSRICVELLDGAEARIVERHVGLPGADEASSADLSREFRIGSRSRLLHVVLQDAPARLHHLQRTHAQVGQEAELSLWSLALGGLLARYEARVDLVGRGAAVSLAGVYALAGRQNADHHLVVNHLARDTRSDMRFRGLLDGHSRGAFTGRVNVPPGSDGAVARQTNDNLLLSPHAEADARPELGIETDDVQCSHGATVGQQDEGAVFYLRSRGIDESTARSLISSAFAIEVLKALPEVSVRACALGMLAAHLPQALSLEEML
jgi:Fe-S cluster assembly protein SufD